MAALPTRTLALWRRASPRVRRRLAVTLALLAAWAVAVAVANRPAARIRLRSSVQEALGRRLPGAEVGESISVDALFRVSFGPMTLRAERKAAPPVFRAERVRVRANPWALFLGRVEPASVRFYEVRIQPGERLAELKALVERLRPSRADAKGTSEGGARSAPHDWPAIHLRGATLVLRQGGRDTELGPFDLSLERERSEKSDDLEVAISHRLGGRAWAQLHRADDGYRLRASVLDVGPSALPARFASSAARWSAGALSADLSISGRGTEPATGRLRARLARSWFTGDRLAPEPIGPVTIDLEGELGFAPSERRIALREATLRLLDAVEGRVDAEARLGPGLPFSLSVDLTSADFDSLADALPAPLRPPPEAPTPAGPLGLHLALSGPLREPSEWSVDAALDLTGLREAARQAPPSVLLGSFTWQPEVERGVAAPSIRLGPESPDFVPLAELPEHVVRAVTTSEDAGFFAHSGFDFQELRNAFAQGAEAGRVVRGASTITQQLAKNLYLSRERTLSRKAREAMVTVGLEASVPKARLLEIYLNIAEWGPGIWGIGPAARHYFGKAARDLTVREAAFLASVIPNPIRYHAYFTRGALDEAWNDRLRVILLHMTEAGVLTEEQFLEAVDAPLVFANGGAGETVAGIPPDGAKDE